MKWNRKKASVSCACVEEKKGEEWKLGENEDKLKRRKRMRGRTKRKERWERRRRRKRRKERRDRREG